MEKQAEHPVALSSTVIAAKRLFVDIDRKK